MSYLALPKHLMYPVSAHACSIIHEWEAVQPFDPCPVYPELFGMDIWVVSIVYNTYKSPETAMYRQHTLEWKHMYWNSPNEVWCMISIPSLFFPGTSLAFPTGGFNSEVDERLIFNSPISSAMAPKGQVWLVELVWRNFGLSCRLEKYELK